LALREERSVVTSRRVISDHVLLGHGGGGLLTRELIESVILPMLDNPLLRPLDDAAILSVESGRLAFTTDSYVVSPLFFPGGDIGKLAVCGTVNDLAVKGAKPLWMSLGLVLEEGLPLVDLEGVIESVGSAAREAGVTVVTGDTKVVEKGRCDGLYINTAGIGRVAAGDPLGPSFIRPGDSIIVSGFLGDHGVAIMARRSGISFSPEVASDCASLWDLVRTVLDAGVHVHAMRDLTRGGLAAALCELAGTAGLGLRVWERQLPVRDAVRGACDLLGLEPMAVANEGKIVLFCPTAEAEEVVAILREHPHGRSAEVVGEVAEEPTGMALMVSRIGGERVIDMPLGEMLPRIC
jgi:hydrogenase expression/formation protein HypE